MFACFIMQWARLRWVTTSAFSENFELQIEQKATINLVTIQGLAHSEILHLSLHKIPPLFETLNPVKGGGYTIILPYIGVEYHIHLAHFKKIYIIFSGKVCGLHITLSLELLHCQIWCCVLSPYQSIWGQWCLKIGHLVTKVQKYFVV